MLKNTDIQDLTGDDHNSTACMDDGEPDVVGVHSLHIECKRVESGTKTLYKWVDQAERDAENGQIPIVMHRSSLQPWLVIVPLDRLKELVIEVDTLLSHED